MPAHPVSGGHLYRLTAFARVPEGGNPAGVWVGPVLPLPAVMQRMAADVGFSETVFLALPESAAEPVVSNRLAADPVGSDPIPTRYFSPEAEVPFCGHATVAAGCVLGQRHGTGQYVLQTRAGEVPVRVSDAGVSGSAGTIRMATLTSVTPRHEPPGGELDAVLGALAWDAGELDETIPPARAYAGAWHLVIAVRTAARLADMHYGFDRMKQIMLDAGLTTLQLVWRERGGSGENGPSGEGRREPVVFHARNPFPVGGVVEDPATGAAAAALGGYLRDSGIMKAPAYFDIRQGEVMGRPSHIHVHVPAAGGVEVSGTAAFLTDH